MNVGWMFCILWYELTGKKINWWCHQKSNDVKFFLKVFSSKTVPIRKDRSTIISIAKLWCKIVIPNLDLTHIKTFKSLTMKMKWISTRPPSGPRIHAFTQNFFEIHAFTQVFLEIHANPIFREIGEIFRKIGKIVKNWGNSHKFGWKGKIHAFTLKAGQIHAFTQ